MPERVGQVQAVNELIAADHLADDANTETHVDGARCRHCQLLGRLATLLASVT